MGEPTISAIKRQWISEKGIKGKVSNPGNSKDAQAFCDQMDKVVASSEALPDLLSLWEAIRPKLLGKITYKYLDSAEGKPLKDVIESCLSILWKEHKIYILQRGELEEYLTTLASAEAKGSKETRLLKIRELVENGRSIDEFFLMGEFNTFLKGVLGLVSASTQTSQVFESEQIPVDTPPVNSTDQE